MVGRVRLTAAAGQPSAAAVRAQEGGNYFAQPARDVNFFSSGCTLLDLALGGGWAEERVSNLVGDRSTGKCGREFYILTARGLELINNLAEQMPYGITPWNQKLALARDKSVKVSHFYKEKVSRTTKVVTEHGFEFEGTAAHPLMVLTPSMDLVMRPLREVEIGDYLVVAPETKFFGKNDISSEWAGLLGFFVADGTLSSGPLVITTQKQWARDKIKQFCEVLKNHIEFSYEVREFDINFKQGRGPQRLTEVLTTAFNKPLRGMTARYKFVPPCVLGSTQEAQVEFLRALISCDSDITPAGLQYVTASKRLAREVHMMLLNLGVVGTLQETSAKLEGWVEARPYWQITLHGQRYDAFLQTVGTYRELSKKKSNIGRTTSSYLSIPHLTSALCEHVTKIRTELKWTKNGKLGDGRRFPCTGLFTVATTGLHTMTRYRAGKIIPILRGFAEEDFLNKCQALVESNYVFEKVTNKTIIDKETDVFDVHVPDEHLFWASGLVSHNTLLAMEGAANFAAKHVQGHIFYREREVAWDEGYARALGIPTERLDVLDNSEVYDTVEDFYEDIQRICAADNGPRAKPKLYILDSLDSLSDREELKRAIDKGTFGAGKAKQISELFRRMIRPMHQAKMTLMVISQVRENIGVTFGEKMTRSGGKALDFYASQRVDLAQLGKIVREHLKIKRVTGVNIRARVKKNKVGLPFREAEFPIKFGYGIDDAVACVEFLKSTEGGLGSANAIIGRLREDVFLKMITQGNGDWQRALDNLREHVQRRWYVIEKKFLPTRRKYQQGGQADGNAGNRDTTTGDVAAED